MPPSTSRPAPKLLSLVVPIYNEEAGLPFLRQSIEEWRRTIPWPLEIVAVNDGSADNSMTLLREWAAREPHVRVIGLSTNFGHQAAVTAGLHASGGDAVVIIDADLQDPLEVIPKMVARYEEGYDVVYGQRISREGETPFKRGTAWLFYRLMRKLVHHDLPLDSGDFRLVSRRCLDAILRMGETHRFLRGMFAWIGFNQIALPYHRRARQHGTTKYPFRKMLAFAWNAAVSFSIIPIRLITYSGGLLSLFGFCYGAFSVWSHFVRRNTVPGWTTIVVLFAIFSGFLLIALGIIGEYVGRIYEQVKQRPLFVIQESINLDFSRDAHPRA